MITCVDTTVLRQASGSWGALHERSLQTTPTHKSAMLWGTRIRKSNSPQPRWGGVGGQMGENGGHWGSIRRAQPPRVAGKWPKTGGGGEKNGRELGPDTHSPRSHSPHFPGGRSPSHRSPLQHRVSGIRMETWEHPNIFRRCPTLRVPRASPIQGGAQSNGRGTVPFHAFIKRPPLATPRSRTERRLRWPPALQPPVPGGGGLANGPQAPLCDITSGCCSFTGPWTVTRCSLRMLRRVAAFCRPLRPVLLLVSFPRSRSPVVGVLGLC